MEVQPIECSKIDVLKCGNDKRTFSREFATNLADTLRIEGMYNPVAVRKSPADPTRYILVAGRHRLYAKKNVLKEQFIDANIVDMDESEAEMAMIAENLWRNPLTKPQHAACLKQWWNHYQARNPDYAIKGKAGGQAFAKKKAEEKKASEASDVAAGENQTGAAAEDSGVAATDAAEKGFVDQVSAATGQSRSAATRSARIAKTFTEDQLQAFVQMNVNQTDMLTIAKIKDEVKRAEVVNLIASGMEPDDAIKEVMKAAAPVRDNGKAKADVEAKVAAAAEKVAELTDDEWFAAYCAEKAAMLGDPARFKADALLYRKITDARHTFRSRVKAAVKATAEAGTKGSFFNAVSRLISFSHPRDWFLCDGCKGTGKVEGDKCGKCYGSCYLLKTETYS